MTLPEGFLDRTAAAPFARRRVLLTGASGFVGGHVARQALAAGVELHTLGRSAVGPGAAHHRADLTDQAAVREAVAAARPEAVIHAAAPGVMPGSADFAAMREGAVNGTEALLAALADSAPEARTVLIGSGFEYRPADAPRREDSPVLESGESYGTAKAAAAAAASAFGDRLALRLLRPFHIYGAGEAPGRLGPFIVGKARAGEAIPLTGGAQQRDFLHVDDAGAMIWAALADIAPQPGFEVYNIGSGDSVTLRAVIEAMTGLLAARGIAADCAFGAVPYREGEPMISLPDLSRWCARGLRAARVALEDGLADLIDAELAR